MSFGLASASISGIVGTALVAGVAMKTIDMVNDQSKSKKKKSRKSNTNHDLMMGYGFQDGYKSKKSKRKQVDPFDFGGFY